MSILIVPNLPCAEPWHKDLVSRKRLDGKDAVAGTIYVDSIQQVQFFQSIWQAEQAELWVSRMSRTHEHAVAFPVPEHSGNL